MSELSDEQLISLCFCGEGFKIGDPVTGGAAYLSGVPFLRDDGLFAAGCTFDNELMFNLGKKCAETAYEKSADIKGAVNAGIIREPFAPGAECFLGEDAHAVYSLVKSYAEGAGGGMAVFGMLGGERDFCERHIDRRALYELYMRPFMRLSGLFSAAVIPAGLFNGAPAYENADLISLIKDSLPDGALILNSFMSVSDPSAAVRAGAGLIAPAFKSNRAALLDALKKGVIARGQIEEFVSGTRAFLDKIKSSPAAQKPAFRPYDEEKALCEKSIVLLENNGVLPVLNPADCLIMNPNAVEGFSRGFGSDAAGNGKTTAIVFARETDGTLEKDAVKNLESAREKGLETVLVIVSPRPCAIPSGIIADAVVFVPKVFEGTANALAEILKGAAEPLGRLPVTWAHSASDYPAGMNPRYKDRGMFTYESVFNGYRYFCNFGAEPRYHFGHGLSYADYKISDASLAADGDKLTIDFTVENLSSRAGETVVFVFDNYLAGRVYGLKRRLVALRRVVLSGNEKKRVHVRVESDEFTAYSEKENGYVFLGGKHEISLAFSAGKDVCKGEIKFKKPEPDFSFCDAKKYPSYYSDKGLIPNAVEVESLTGAKLFAPQHRWGELVLSPGKTCSEKTLKKAAKLIKGACGEDFDGGLGGVPPALIEKLIK